jgi:predicted ATP-grasp superfamily ATP-dependent carboligase
MQPLIWDRRPDGLRAPAMVCAFQGWNDAGDAASSAVSFLASALDARRFARIDSEEFYDFQTNRPSIRFVENEHPELGDTSEGAAREIRWPTVEIFEATAPRAPRDLVIVQGVEPSMRWRAFCNHIVDLAEALGVQVVVSLGALLGDVPHTRPVAMTGHASDAALLERLGMHASSYEGPTGIVGVLHTACAQAGLPSASLWASVPHYVAAASNPKAALALLRRVEVLIGVSVDVTELESSAADYERQVGLAVRSDPDIQAFVERLEQAADSEGQSTPEEELPSGDILASEFQRFLRQRGREGK